MKYGFIKVGAATPVIRVADCAFNAAAIVKAAEDAAAQQVRILALPELCLTGYTCGDLFLQTVLLNAAHAALLEICEKTALLDLLMTVGLPVRHKGKLFNCAAVLHRGRVLGIVPKTHLPNYGEFYEQRHFTSASVLGDMSEQISGFGEAPVPFGVKQLFCCEQQPALMVAVEICEDLWAPTPPSAAHTAAGATLIVNLSASDETLGKDRYRRDLVTGQSARLCCGYLYADAGEGESTTDLVFAAHNIVAENGELLAQSALFANEMAVSELDVCRMADEHRRLTTYPDMRDEGYLHIPFSLPQGRTHLTRFVSDTPFVPHDAHERAECCEQVLSIQAHALKKRLTHTGAKRMVLGISGGLDSALALLAAVRAAALTGHSRTDIVAVTMPCFGTTARTKGNAERLCERLGVTLKQVDIRAAVEGHFADIGHDPAVQDVTYENAQARERTQVLMDLANRTGGLVIGTGDLSELALGWATYNGDHMSMYGVNASIPKTLIRHLIAYEAGNTEDQVLREVLLDIADTPVSPELLPPKDGEIEQKTEDVVGPYLLHDFFIYYFVRFGFSPRKIYRLARYAFDGQFDRETIVHWMRVFLRRFFSQQFKRSCLPDGPKIGSVSLSPRGDWRMPSDAVSALWLTELDTIQ